MTYITSVAQGINVIHPAIPAKAPLPPPAETRWHKLTGTDKLLWPVTLVQTSDRLSSPDGASNVGQSPRSPDALRWQPPACSHCATQRERGRFATQRRRERNCRESTQGLSAPTLRHRLMTRSLPLTNAGYSNCRCLYLSLRDVERSGGCVTLSGSLCPHRNMKLLIFCYQDCSPAGLNVPVHR